MNANLIKGNDMKRHKHRKTPALLHSVPKQAMGDYMHGGSVLHPTKGWRRIKRNVPTIPWWDRLKF